MTSSLKCHIKVIDALSLKVSHVVELCFILVQPQRALLVSTWKCKADQVEQAGCCEHRAAHGSDKGPGAEEHPLEICAQKLWGGDRDTTQK